LRLAEIATDEWLFCNAFMNNADSRRRGGTVELSPSLKMKCRYRNGAGLGAVYALKAG
jgi:hypothetical protein